MPIQAPKMIFVPLREHRAPYTLWECDHVKLSLAENSVGVLRQRSGRTVEFDIIEDFSVHAEALEAFRTFFQQLAKLVRARQLGFIDLHPTHPAAPVAVC